MMKHHDNDPSTVLFYICDMLYTGKIINIKELAFTIDYDISSVYAILRKIKLNLIIFNSSFKIIKISPGNIKMVKISEKV